MKMKRTAQTCEMIFGQKMKPCPNCGSFNIGWQTPIKMNEAITKEDDARSILGKYARSIKGGNTPLEGPVFLWCKDCRHKGPSMDCSGRTSESVGQDKEVAKEVKRLWNSEVNIKASSWICDLGNGEWDHHWEEHHDSSGELDGHPGQHWSWRECKECGVRDDEPEDK